MMSSICSFLVIFSVISNVHGSVVKRATCNESTALNSTLKQAVLDAVNLRRSQVSDAADMLKLVWSDRVASIAQNNANVCMASEDQCDYLGLTPKNVYLWSNSQTISTDDISDAVRSWATGSQYYNSTSGHCPDNSERWNQCQTYKKLVFASSQEIGCGMSACSVRGGPVRLFICYYNPAGFLWIPNQIVYWQGTPCSKCNERTGSWSCENNLCVA